MRKSFFTLKDELWFQESLYNDCGQVFKVDKKICSTSTPYQSIDIFSNKVFGKILALDGIVQLTEFDEYIYHEAMAHSPLFLSEKHNKKVCIVGGGDGGVLREVVRHDSVSEITLLEVDKEVIKLCTKHLPDISNGAYNDKRVNIIYADAVEYLKKVNIDTYDVVIVDSTDPNEFAKDLYSAEFYSVVSYVLKDDGFAIFQSGSILMQKNEYIDGYNKLKSFFKNISLLKIVNATYYGGEFCLLLATNNEIKQLQKVHENYVASNIDTKWYSPQKFMASLVDTPLIKNNLIH